MNKREYSRRQGLIVRAWEAWRVGREARLANGNEAMIFYFAAQEVIPDPTEGAEWDEVHGMLLHAGLVTD